jgi:hypothetical protein
MTIKVVIGIVVGGAAGYIFYRFVGCRSGACLITGNMYISIIYGARIGAVLGWGRG